MSIRLTIPAVKPLTLALAAAILLPTTLLAQSASRSIIPSSPAPQGSNFRSTTGGSDSRAVAAGPTALSGYCPVCVIDMKKWVRGNPSIQAPFDGRIYFFSGEEQRQQFLANPQKYVPVLGGDCAVCLTDMKKRIPGSVHHAALSGGRLFLFPNAEIKEKFRTDPGKYLHADLALGGHCAVCRVEMNKAVQGNPEMSLIYGGMRYQFPGEDQLKMFISNPAKYSGIAGVSGGSGMKPGGSGTK